MQFRNDKNAFVPIVEQLLIETLFHGAIAVGKKRNQRSAKRPGTETEIPQKKHRQCQ
jgi:hypothetical protein